MSESLPDVEAVHEQQTENEDSANHHNPFLGLAPNSIEWISRLQKRVSQEIPDAHVSAVLQKLLELSVYLCHGQLIR